MNPAHLSPARQHTIRRLLCQAFMVHGIRIFTISLGIYLACFEGRGWPPVIIACILAIWTQTRLPDVPRWLEKMRPDDGA